MKYEDLKQCDKTSLKWLFKYELLEKTRKLTPSESATKKGIRICIGPETTTDILPEEIKRQCRIETQEGPRNEVQI